MAPAQRSCPHPALPFLSSQRDGESLRCRYCNPPRGVPGVPRRKMPGHALCTKLKDRAECQRHPQRDGLKLAADIWVTGGTRYHPHSTDNTCSTATSRTTSGKLARGDLRRPALLAQAAGILPVSCRRSTEALAKKAGKSHRRRLVYYCC